MTDNERKRSPRCPSVSIEEAIQRIDELYKIEKTHFVVADAAAQGLGYKDANSGAAKTMIASLSYYGLLRRSAEGRISVSPDYEKYTFAPTQDIKSRFLNEWLRKPKIFSQLIEKYNDNLPSDSALAYELIEAGFKPATANEAAIIFRKSLDFVKNLGFALAPTATEDLAKTDLPPSQTQDEIAGAAEKSFVSQMPNTNLPAENFKSITIFLPRNREAVLHISRPFFAKDKEAIKSQIEAILTDDEDT